MEIRTKGQSTVEYVLLLAVVGLLAFSIFNSATIRRFIGADGEIFQGYGAYMGYSYRHGRQGSYTGNLQESYLSDHDTYRSDTFRIPNEVYPGL